MNLVVGFVSFLSIWSGVYAAYLGRPGIVLKPPPLQSIVFSHHQVTTTPSPTYSSTSTTTTLKSNLTFQTSFGDWINGQTPIKFPQMITDAIKGQGGQSLSV